jgi:hypothetical protein
MKRRTERKEGKKNERQGGTDRQAGRKEGRKT